MGGGAIGRRQLVGVDDLGWREYGRCCGDLGRSGGGSGEPDRDMGNTGWEAGLGI